MAKEAIFEERSSQVLVVETAIDVVSWTWKLCLARTGRYLAAASGCTAFWHHNVGAKYLLSLLLTTMNHSTSLGCLAKVEDIF